MKRGNAFTKKRLEIRNLWIERRYLQKLGQDYSLIESYIKHDILHYRFLQSVTSEVRKKEEILDWRFDFATSKLGYIEYM